MEPHCTSLGMPSTRQGLAGAVKTQGTVLHKRKRCARKNQVPNGPLHTKSSPKKHRWCRCLAERISGGCRIVLLLLPSLGLRYLPGPLRLPFTQSGRTVRSFALRTLGLTLR